MKKISKHKSTSDCKLMCQCCFKLIYHPHVSTRIFITSNSICPLWRTRENTLKWNLSYNNIQCSFYVCHTELYDLKTSSHLDIKTYPERVQIKYAEQTLTPHIKYLIWLSSSAKSNSSNLILEHIQPELVHFVFFSLWV